jgi:hypothetical protein
MSQEQYKEGVCLVTNGSAVVTGTDTLWDTAILAGNVFKLDLDGDAAYEIASVDSDTQITLSTNYQGSTASAQPYMVQRSFTPYLLLARPFQGDADLADILRTQVIDKIDSIVGALNSTGENNLLINGNGVVAQRSDYTLVKDAYDFGKCDRFEGMATGTAVSAGTLTQSTSASAGKTGFAHKFSGVTITGTGIIYHRTRLESKDAARLKNQVASIGMTVYHDVGSQITYTITIRKADAADDFSATTEISNDGGTGVDSATETTLSFANVSMGDCSNGIEIELKIECGAITTKNFEISDVKIEQGITASPFKGRFYKEEFELCQRYYQVMGQGCQGEWQSATDAYINGHFLTEMRAAPQETLLTSTPQFRHAGTTKFGVSSTVTATNYTTTGYRIVIDGFTGATPGYATFSATDPLLSFDAEL